MSWWCLKFISFLIQQLCNSCLVWLTVSIISCSLSPLMIGSSITTKTWIPWIFYARQLHNPVLLHCINYMGKWPAVKLGFLGEQCARTLLLFRNVQTKNASFFFFFFFLNTTASTGAVLIWVNFLLLGQMKTSPSFVATVFLRSLNQPKAFCSACGAALVLPCSSSSSVLSALLITS